MIFALIAALLMVGLVVLINRSQSATDDWQAKARPRGSGKAEPPEQTSTN